MCTTLKKNTTILYMDDDSDDLLFLEEALRSVDTCYQILHAFDGIEGLERLAQMKVEANLPCKIVLDINMPRLGDRETFLQSKPTPTFAIPVVVFSTTANPKEKACFAGPNVAYVVKPINFTHLIEVVKELIVRCNKAA